MKKISNQLFQFIITFVIIFSNYSYGKEFQKLFEITIPMNQVSNIDVAIGKSFNDLIFRLTGSNNPTNIKKIAPSLKIKKDFLISYEPININDQPYLITKFDKDSLIEKLESLQIAIIGYNRPTIMVLMKIEDGNKPPYFLNTSSNSPLDNKIKIILEEVSNQRGIFFELPVFDLEDINQLKTLTILDSEKEIILSNYEYDFALDLNLSQSSINQWIILGDYKSKNKLSLKLTLENLKTSVNSLTDKYLSNFIISDSETAIEVIVNNIFSYNDLITLQDSMQRLISIKTSKIESYVDNSITYSLIINGDINSFKKEIRANPNLQLIESNDNVIFGLITN